ncbi:MULTISPECIES: DNA polymerase III subunit gamma/tau [Glaesserella]|uniref:DNA polymerase III subunit gamma/tau n=1 Tax=Glaesserella australis TaxID=2094024 RepID=A0A328BYY1_9PAST|nr:MULTISPECIES: DNA polymerase III subunit gamma/tau [Glaesserella]AUI65988.1 DNA polymerase III subunit gamma/tau [Glaesserella sp. 15-184]RAL18292.1 DNA polymerase III subunit gamma/tau [Glaesserella australis]
MSYQVLARKWRPQRFSEVVGQQHVLSALENGLREGRLHHAYLFSGTRGVGKTSIARLFAKGLNCETGITADPCGQCANCKAIEEGRFIDLIEIDAASRTKVEDTRELLDNVQYKPTVGRFKVYLIDEVHMLSRHSFNALLKTLEEPPEYVKFLLATTDPQKLPITILSRCMQFHLRALDVSQIQQHLEFILTQEQIPFELPALAKLAKSAQGSIRDSLSLTDQAIAVSNANITLPIVSQMLGLIDDHQPLELVQALANADGEKAMAVIRAVAEKGVDWQQLLSDTAETLHQIAMLQLLKQPNQEETPLHFLAKQISPEDVQFFYQVMLTGKKELPFAPEQRSGVEMTMLRALAFHPKNISVATVQPTAQQPTQSVAPVQAPNSISQLRERLAQQQSSGMTQQAVTSEQNFAKNSQQQPASSTLPPNNGTEGMSPALLAMKARQQLKAKQEQNDEKKKSELTPPILTPKPPKKSIHQGFASLVSAQEEREKALPAVKPKPKENVSDEEYRWTWLNPELENQEEAPKPSDIKQAILQEKTPELVKKTIELACEKDEWSRIVQNLKIGGVTRQLVLNSYLAEKQGNHLKLMLKPSMAHLKNEESVQSLNNAFAQQELTYEMAEGESHEFQTPLELRRTIFEQLTLEAKQALQADEKLKLLQQAFDAQMDESTIRAVAE